MPKMVGLKPWKERGATLGELQHLGLEPIRLGEACPICGWVATADASSSAAGEASTQSRFHPH